MKKTKQNTVVGLNSVKTQNNKGGINMKKFNLNYRDASLKHIFVLGGESVSRSLTLLKKNVFSGKTDAIVEKDKITMDLGEIVVILDKNKKMSRYFVEVIDESGTKTIDPEKPSTTREEYQEYEEIQSKMAEIGAAIHASRSIIGNLKSYMKSKHSYDYNNDKGLRALTFIFNLLEAQKILDKKGETNSSVLKMATSVLFDKNINEAIKAIHEMAVSGDLVAQACDAIIESFGINTPKGLMPLNFLMNEIKKNPIITAPKINEKAIEREVVREEPLTAEESLEFMAEMPKTQDKEITVDENGDFVWNDLETSNEYYHQVQFPTIVIDDGDPTEIDGCKVIKVDFVEKADAKLERSIEHYAFIAVDEKKNFLKKDGKKMMFTKIPSAKSNDKYLVSDKPFVGVQYYLVVNKKLNIVKDDIKRPIIIEDSKKYITNRNYVRDGEIVIKGFANVRLSKSAKMYYIGSEVKKQNLDIGRIFYKQVKLSKFVKKYNMNYNTLRRMFFKVRNSNGSALDIYNNKEYFADYRYFADRMNFDRHTISYDFSSKNNYFSVASPAAENDYTAIASRLYNVRTDMNAPKRKSSTGVQFGSGIKINKLADEFKLDTQYGVKEYNENYAIVGHVEKQDGSTNPVGNPVLINKYTLDLVDKQDSKVLNKYGVLKIFFDNALTKSIANAETKATWAYVPEVDRMVRVNFVLPNDSRSGTESIQLNGTERMAKVFKQSPKTGKFDAVFFDEQMQPVVVEGKQMSGFVTLSAIDVDITMDRNTDKRNTKVGSIQQRSWPSATRIIFDQLLETYFHHLARKSYAWNIQSAMKIGKLRVFEKELKKLQTRYTDKRNSVISELEYRQDVERGFTVPSVELNFSSKEHVFVESEEAAEKLVQQLGKVFFFGYKMEFHKVVEKYNSNYYLVKPLALMMTMVNRILKGHFSAIDLDVDTTEIVEAMQELFASAMTTRIPVLSGVGTCVGSHLNREDGVYLTAKDFVRLVTEFKPTHSRGGRTHMKNLIESFNGNITKAAEKFLEDNRVVVWASRDPDLGLTKEVPVLGIDNTIFGIGLTTSLALRLGWDFDGDIGKLKLISIDRK